MNSKALLRMVEALLAAIMILVAFTISYYYASPPNPFTVRAREDLEKVAYDLLHRLAEEKSLDEMLASGNPSLWRYELASALRTLLPKNIIYNLTIYNGTKTSDYSSVIIHIYNITGGDVDLYVTSPSGNTYSSEKHDVNFEILNITDPEVGDWRVEVRWVDGEVSYLGAVIGNKTGILSFITSFSGTLNLGGYHEYHFWLYTVTLERLCEPITNIDDPKAIVRASETGEATLTYTYSTLSGEFYTLVMHLTLARAER